MNKKPYSQSEYISKISSINPDVEVLGQYINAHSKILVRCKKCGTSWEPKAYSLIQGRGCPKCARKKGAKNNSGKTGLKTKEKFMEELSQVDSLIMVTGEYVNTHTNIKCKCGRCNHIWDI